MLQRGGVYSTMCARDVVCLFAAFYDDPADPAELIERVGLQAVDRTPWRRLSGGEQQRLSLALALVGRPQLAFLDEPSAGVDPAGRQLLWSAIRELRAGKPACSSPPMTCRRPSGSPTASSSSTTARSSQRGRRRR